ncbi:MAG: hypothetical protein IKO01_01360 [Kiritimatiellae bacterium]|nr:hypothetical protein [Kiritimatiellia bacterium]
MKRKWLGLALAAAMACAGAATQSTADVLAEDSAANYTAETFVSGANLGSGFGAWEFWNAAPTLADSAAGLCGDINSENGVSFRFAQDGVEDHWGYCNGYRGFDALNPGDVLTFRFTCAYCGGNRGLDLFANGGHDDSDKIANVINLSGDNEYSVNGVVIANNWAPHAVSEVTVSQLEDGIEIAIKRTSTEEGVEDLEYSTKVETSSKLTGIGLYAGGWEWNDGADVENYAFYVNDLKIEGIPPADTLKLEGPWAVTKATADLEFTLTRKSTDGDLEVALTSSYPEFAAVPDTVTIPDGESSVTFVVAAAVQGNGNVAAIQASAEGIAGDSFEVKGPSYSCNPWDEGVEDPWNVDVDEARTFYVDSPFFEDAGFDNSLVTVASSDESVIGIASKQDWAQGENGMYAAWTVTGIGGGKATAQVLFAGIPMTEYGFTVPQAGATLSGPTSLRVGNEATYTLAVTLAGDIESDTFQLVADNEDLVSIEPSDAQELTESGTLEFKVTALKEGDVTLSVIDDKALDTDIAPITVSITEAPDYSGYVAYDDASLYDLGDLNYASVGEGTDKFLPWDEVYKNADGESTFAGAVVVTAAPDPSALTEGQAFALYANGADGAEIQLRRPFANPLDNGQAFSVVVSPNYRDGTKGVKFMGVWEGEWYPRAEFFYNNDGYFYKLDGDEDATNLGWEYGTDAITITLKKAADGSSYTLSFARGDEIVAKEGITSFAGTVDAAQFYSWQGGNGDENNLVFNSLAIQQVEEPVVERAIGWAAGVWNPDAAGEYKFAISATTDDIGEVALTVEPSDGALSLSTASVDLTGKLEESFAVILSEANEGDSFVIKATPADTTVDPIEYNVTVSGTYVTLSSDNWEYPVSAGEIWLALTASVSKYGTYTISSEDVGVLTVPDDSVSITVDSPDQKWFNVTIVGPGKAKIYATAEGATEPAANFEFTITADAPVIDGTTMETVSFADGFSGMVTQEFAEQFNSVRAKVLQWNGEAKAFVDVEELDNEVEWPDMKFTPSIDNPVIRLIFEKK